MTHFRDVRCRKESKNAQPSVNLRAVRKWKNGRKRTGRVEKETKKTTALTGERREEHEHKVNEAFKVVLELDEPVADHRREKRDEEEERQAAQAVAQHKSRYTVVSVQPLPREHLDINTRLVFQS